MTTRIRAIVLTDAAWTTVGDRRRGPVPPDGHERPWMRLTRCSYRLRNRRVGRPLPLPPTEYRLMWYTDLLSSHRGTSENTPPHCCSAVLLSQPTTFSLSRLSSLFPCLSPAFPFRFYFSPFLSHAPIPLPFCLSFSRFCKIISFE